MKRMREEYRKERKKEVLTKIKKNWFSKNNVFKEKEKNVKRIRGKKRRQVGTRGLFFSLIL
jgi:hypothetical protein